MTSRAYHAPYRHLHCGARRINYLTRTPGSLCARRIVTSWVSCGARCCEQKKGGLQCRTLSSFGCYGCHKVKSDSAVMFAASYYDSTMRSLSAANNLIPASRMPESWRLVLAVADSNTSDAVFQLDGPLPDQAAPTR